MLLACHNAQLTGSIKFTIWIGIWNLLELSPTKIYYCDIADFSTQTALNCAICGYQVISCVHLFKFGDVYLEINVSGDETSCSEQDQLDVGKMTMLIHPIVPLESGDYAIVHNSIVILSAVILSHNVIQKCAMMLAVIKVWSLSRKFQES